MASKNWSRKKVGELFSGSEGLVIDARQQEKSNGVCFLPPPHKGKLLPESTIQKFVEFYENNEYRKIMPGMKDRITGLPHPGKVLDFFSCPGKSLKVLEFCS